MQRQGIRSSVNVPIHADGQRIGSLHVNHQRPHYFGRPELNIAEALAAQAGAAIERAGLAETERSQLRERLANERAVSLPHRQVHRAGVARVTHAADVDQGLCRPIAGR